MWGLIFKSRIVQIVMTVLITSASVGAHSWWTNRAEVASLNQQIVVLKKRSEEKIVIRKEIKQEEEAGIEAIKNGDFVDFFNANN
jgi:hypothetical protein